MTGGRLTSRRRCGRSFGWGTLLWCIGIFLTFWAAGSLVAEEARKPVKIDVSGFGILGNRALKRTLELVSDPENPPAFFTATQIEDAALLLLAQVREEGYLRPRVEARLTLDGGETANFSWTNAGFTELPRPMRAVEVHFVVHRGERFFFEEITFYGLTVIDEETARSYFVATGYLIETRRARLFTPSRLEGGMNSIRDVLISRGYESAIVLARELEQDAETGAVRVAILVDEGPLSLVRGASVVIEREGEVERRDLDVAADQAFSRAWLQDREQELRAEFYELGYPDVAVSGEIARREYTDDEVLVDVVIRVEPGPYITMGEVIFDGLDKTRESVVRRRIDLKEGKRLNRLEVDEGRFRLARLGVFASVEVDYEDADEGRRNVVYRVREGKELDINVLFGYGSYEMFRVGLEVEQYNLFGRAHRSRLQLTQSLRSSSVNYRYTVPELFGEEIHGFGTLFGLRREEPDYDRREFGSSVGVQRYFWRLDLDSGLRYLYQLLESRSGVVSGPDGLDRAVVSAVELSLQRDRRDNPIYPTDGYQARTVVEAAFDKLGGEVDYQRLELDASYHHDFGGGLFLHLGANHGILNTFGEVAREVPITRRFLTGGENSVRGYLEGEASPRNENGELVGSETYTLVNLELEQALTQRWSVVVFGDWVGFARRFDDYPIDESLYSIGLGIRYKTLIGPIRLEYGHNVNPREDDPSGAVHLSIGFPF